MARNHLPPSLNPSDESLSEDEHEVNANSDTIGSDSSDKTATQVRGLDYKSDADSGNTFPSPTASGFILKPNSKSEVISKKRVAADADKSEELKKKKTKKNGCVTGRLWCREDELIMLKGMIDYKREKGVDVSSNLDAFHVYIKGSLNAVADKRQLSSKIRKLREKYQANAIKEANCEAHLSFNGHEAKAYEYSKKIWGHKQMAGGSQATKVKLKSKKEVNVVTCSRTSILESDSVLALPGPELEVTSKVVNSSIAKVSSRVPKVAQKMDFDEADCEMECSNLLMPVMVDSFVVEEGMELVERSKLDALNKKWVKYQLDAAELYVKRVELVREQTRLIIDSVKSNS